MVIHITILQLESPKSIAVFTVYVFHILLIMGLGYHGMPKSMSAIEEMLEKIGYQLRQNWIYSGL